MAFLVPWMVGAAAVMTSAAIPVMIYGSTQWPTMDNKRDVSSELQETIFAFHDPGNFTAEQLTPVLSEIASIEKFTGFDGENATFVYEGEGFRAEGWMGGLANKPPASGLRIGDIIVHLSMSSHRDEDAAAAPVTPLQGRWMTVDKAEPMDRMDDIWDKHVKKVKAETPEQAKKRFDTAAAILASPPPSKLGLPWGVPPTQPYPIWPYPRPPLSAASSAEKDKARTSEKLEKRYDPTNLYPLPGADVGSTLMQGVPMELAIWNAIHSVPTTLEKVAQPTPPVEKVKAKASDHLKKHGDPPLPPCGGSGEDWVNDVNPDACQPDR